MTERRTALAAVALAGLTGVAALAGLAGCGSSGPALSSDAAGQLGAEVQGIRAAALRDDPSEAARLLAELRAAVTQLESQHQISAARADATLAAAAAVEAQLAALPTTTTTTTLAPAPPPPPGKHGKHAGPGDGNSDG